MRVMMALAMSIGCTLSLGACTVASLTGKAAGSTSVAGEVQVPARAQAQFDDGLRAMEAQAWDVALPTMELVWQQYPWYAGPALNAALIHQREGRPEDAELWFTRATEANGDNLEVRNSYGIFLREQGRYREAETQYLAALAASEGDARTHYNIGILCDLYLGDKARALQHFSRYLEVVGEQNRQVAGWVADLQRQVAQEGGGAS